MMILCSVDKAESITNQQINKLSFTFIILVGIIATYVGTYVAVILTNIINGMCDVLLYRRLRGYIGIYPRRRRYRKNLVLRERINRKWLCTIQKEGLRIRKK